MINTKERLDEALRQYRHNNSDEFVAGYDLQLIAKLVEDLEQENANLRATLGGAQLDSDSLREVAAEMRERKVNHGRDTSPTLERWADRIEACARLSSPATERPRGEYRRELLNLAQAKGAVLTGKPDGSEAITLVFSIEAWRAFDLATRPKQAGSALAFKEELLKASKIFLHPFIEGVYAVFETQQREGGA